METIDVAYRYFSTPKDIIADAPGHVQYTRGNMITGASNSQLIIILIDARLGVIEQTGRLLYYCFITKNETYSCCHQ